MKHLKPLLLGGLLGVLCAFSANAQIEVGAKFGANINQFNQPGTIFGFNGGAFGRYKVLDFLSARVELLYMQQGGARQDFSRDYNDWSAPEGSLIYVWHTNRYVNLNNLEIPVIAELSHPSFASESVIPKLLLGAAYGFNLAAIEHHDKTYIFNGGSTDRIMISDFIENVGDNYKQHQFGLVAGFAVDYKVGEHTFTTELRYRRSFNQLNQFRFGVQDQDGLPGTIGQEGDLYSSTLSINFAMTILSF
jgi:hypothetical protein